MTSHEWQQLQARIAGDLLGSARPADVEALEQLLRARSHPQVHDARAQLHARLQKAPRAYKRRLSSVVSTDTLRSLHHDVARAEQAYRNGEVSVEEYIDLLLMLALFEKGLFDELTTVLLAQETRDRLKDRLAHMGVTTSEELLWKEHQALQRELWQERRQESPSLIREVEPLVIETQSGTFLLPLRVRLYDALTGEYALDVDEPRRARTHTVTRSTTVPWHDAQTGVLMHMSLPDETGWHHEPIHVMLWPHQLSEMAAKGTAVPTRIGPGEEIDVHPEFFPAGRAGDDVLATARLAPGGLEIRKIFPDLQLTLTA